MLANRHLAPGVDTTLLKTHFAVATNAVWALILPVNPNELPSTVNLVSSFFSFSGFTSQNILPYVTFLSLGTWYLGMNMTVFVPLTSLTPWANCTNSFEEDLSQNFLSGPLIRCLFSWAAPEIWWVTALVSRVFWHCAVNAYCGQGFFLPLDLKLELCPPLSTLGCCAVFTLGGGIWTSGGKLLGPDG